MPDSRKATRTLTLRLTPEDDDAVRRGAELQKIGPSTFARNAVLKAAARKVVAGRKTSARDIEASHRFAGAVAQLSGITRKLASQAQSGRADAGEIAALVLEVAALRASLSRAFSA